MKDDCVEENVPEVLKKLQPWHAPELVELTLHETESGTRVFQSENTLLNTNGSTVYYYPS
jgi:hypothetical protein